MKKYCKNSAVSAGTEVIDVAFEEYQLMCTVHRSRMVAKSTLALSVQPQRAVFICYFPRGIFSKII